MTGALFANEEEKLRASLFEGQLDKKSCLTVGQGPKALEKLKAPGLKFLLRSFIHALKENEPSSFKAFFHKKTKVKNSIGENILTPLNFRYKRPFDVSPFRIYALNTVDGNKDKLPCKEDGIQVTPIYGYHLQFGAWLQVMGQNDLARIYLAIASSKGQWKVVGLHVQQWTFAGHDFEHWTQKGLLEKTHRVRSHMYFDVAQKLLFGGDFISFNIKPKLLEEVDLVLSKDDWIALAKEKLSEKNLVYLGTTLGRDGLGIVVRVKVAGLLSKDDFEKRCKALGRSMTSLKWLLPKGGGLQCQFLLAREDFDKEGIMGGQYFTFAELNSIP